MIEFNLDRYQSLRVFLDDLSAHDFFKGAVKNIELLHRKYGEDYLQFAEDTLAAVKKIGVEPVPVFRAYLIEYLRDLARFQNSGEYANGPFEEIREKIYDNAELMSETYLPGIFLAYGFTSLLHEKYKLFERRFLPRLEADMRGVEIGFGDGFYFWVVLNNVPGSSMHGYDISQHAVDFTARLLSAEGVDSHRYDLRFGNLCEQLPIEQQAYDWCILTEVVEHVADPVFSLAEINRILRPGGLLFISTVIDCNHMDHITNFENPKAVVDLLEAAGFVVEDHMEYKVSDEVEDCRDRAVSLAYVCRKT